MGVFSPLGECGAVNSPLGTSHITDGAELVWHVSFQSGNYSGGAFLDAIGSNNVDPNHAPSFTDGYWDLDGSNDYGDAGDILEEYIVGIGKKFTIEVRVKRASGEFTSSRGVLLKQSNTVRQLALVVINNGGNGQIQFIWYEASATVAFRRRSQTKVISDDNWHTIKATYDQTAATLEEGTKIYLDGEVETSYNDATFGTPGYIHDTVLHFGIGAYLKTDGSLDPALDDYLWKGQLDYIKLYNGIV
jgi:hypothetical protein